MRVAVLIKQVPKNNALDYDAAENEIRFKSDDVCMNYDDANNLEAALRLKDDRGEGRECHITVVTLGDARALSTVREALAAGADEGCLIRTDCRELTSGAPAAGLLSRALEKLGSFDLILAGYQSQDSRNGTVGAMVAERLGIPQVSHADGFEVKGSLVTVQKRLGNNVEEIRLSAPCLISNLPQPYSLRGITYMGITEAMGKEVVCWEESELETRQNESRAPVLLYSLPQQRGRKKLVMKDGERENLVYQGIISQLTLHHHAKR